MILHLLCYNIGKVITMFDDEDEIDNLDEEERKRLKNLGLDEDEIDKVMNEGM